MPSSRLDSFLVYPLRERELPQGVGRVHDGASQAFAQRYGVHRTVQGLFRHQSKGRPAVIQITESRFSSDRAYQGVRQLYVYAKRHYLQMPRYLKGKELLARHTIGADRTGLREFADLAESLGFESPEITALKKHPRARDARNPSEVPNSTRHDGAGVKKKRRCGLRSVEGIPRR